MKPIRCPNCGYKGTARRVVKGSFLIEILLWVLFIIPGLFYTLWRLTTKYDACPMCGWRHVALIN